MMQASTLRQSRWQLVLGACAAGALLCWSASVTAADKQRAISGVPVESKAISGVPVESKAISGVPVESKGIINPDSMINPPTKTQSSGMSGVPVLPPEAHKMMEQQVNTIKRVLEDNLTQGQALDAGEMSLLKALENQEQLDQLQMQLDVIIEQLQMLKQ